MNVCELAFLFHSVTCRTESPEFLRREVAALTSLSHHPNIADLYGAFEDDENVYIAMEVCTGGELFHRIISKSGPMLAQDCIVSINKPIFQLTFVTFVVATRISRSICEKNAPQKNKHQEKNTAKTRTQTTAKALRYSRLDTAYLRNLVDR